MRLRFPERLSAVDLILWGLRIAIVVFVLVASYATLSQGLLPPERWPDLLVNGLSAGSIYALIALGYTLVYGVLFMINFAHGEVFMAGVFTAFFAATALADSGMLDSNPIVGLAIIFGVSMLTSMVIALLLERVAYRPLRRAPRLVPLITALGASLFLQYTFRGLYGSGVRSYPSMEILQGTINVMGTEVLKTQAIVIVSAVILMVGLYVFVQRTRTGRAMRAVSEDKDVAAMMGINVDRVIATTFAIGGVLAGATGILYVMLFNIVSFSMGFLPGIKAFTAAVLGGIGNIVGAMLGGIFLGLLESFGPRLLLSGFGVPAINQLRDVVAFMVLVLVLIFRPYGILGRKE